MLNNLSPNILQVVITGKQRQRFRTHLNAGFRQANLLGQTLPGEHVRVVGAFELLLQTIDLIVRKRRPIALQLPLQSQPHLAVVVLPVPAAVRPAIRVLTANVVVVVQRGLSPRTATPVDCCAPTATRQPCPCADKRCRLRVIGRQVDQQI